MNPPEHYTIDAPRFRIPAQGRRFGRLRDNISDWRFPSDKPHRCRRLIERMAYFLMRERDLDSPPYSAGSDDQGVLGHLFSYDFDVGKSRAIGAACFAWREWTNHEPGHCLEWVWIHPYFRRMGILARSWEAYRTAYGDFTIGPPYSPAMVDFLIKVNHPHSGTPWKEWKKHLLSR